MTVYICSEGYSLLILSLTVRPSHNILQKSILRGHKSPPTPRHPEASLSRLQVNLYSSICCLSSWCLRLRGAAWISLHRGSGCLVCSLATSSNPVRWRLFTHLIIQERKTTPGRTAQEGQWLCSSTVITNRTHSAICWIHLCAHVVFSVTVSSINCNRGAKYIY